MAELRASAVSPHHRHLPADPALNRYVVTRTRQTLPAAPPAFPGCPVFTVYLYKLFDFKAFVIPFFQTDPFFITVVIKLSYHHLFFNVIPHLSYSSIV